jgi:hypothetical protein
MLTDEDGGASASWRSLRFIACAATQSEGAVRAYRTIGKVSTLPKAGRELPASRGKEKA